jgi:hypothetical protein
MVWLGPRFETIWTNDQHLKSPISINIAQITNIYNLWTFQISTVIWFEFDIWFDLKIDFVKYWFFIKIPVICDLFFNYMSAIGRCPLGRGFIVLTLKIQIANVCKLWTNYFWLILNFIMLNRNNYYMLGRLYNSGKNAIVVDSNH